MVTKPSQFFALFPMMYPCKFGKNLTTGSQDIVQSRKCHTNAEIHTKTICPPPFRWVVITNNLTTTVGILVFIRRNLMFNWANWALKKFRNIEARLPVLSTNPMNSQSLTSKHCDRVLVINGLGFYPLTRILFFLENASISHLKRHWLHTLIRVFIAHISITLTNSCKFQ